MDGGVALHPAQDADAAQEEARRLAARVQQLEEDLRFSRERHSLVEQQVETLLTQLSSSTGAQRRLAGEAGRLKTEADSLRWQLESAQRTHTTQNEQYEEEVKALRSQRDGLSREKVLVEADCRNRQQTIRQLQRDVESLKGQVQAAAMQADEKADLLFRALADKDEIMTKYKSACEKLKELDLQLKTQAEESAKDIKQALEASKEAWAAADAEVEAKQALLEELRNKHAASMERMANEYAQEITRLREQLRQEREERAKMQADNALLEPRNYSPAVRAFLQDPRNADYNRMLAEVQDLKDLVKDERTARAEAEKELKRERHSLEEARRHAAGRERKAEEMQTMADQYIVRSTHLARELKNMQEALRVVEKDKEELSRENKRLTREVNQFSRQVQFLLFDEYRRARALTRGWGEPGETDIRILVFSDVQQLQAQNANLLAQLNEAEEQRNGWHREQQERAEVYAEYDQRLQRMENARGEMQGMLAQVAAENRSLRAQLEASTQEATSRAIVPSVPQLPPPQHDVSTAIVPSGSSSADAGQLTRAVGRIASLEQELEEAKTMVQAAFQQLDETRTKLNQMAGGKVAAETDCKFWKDRCEDANRRADNHQKSIASYEDRLREAKKEALDAKSKADEAVSQTRRLTLDLDGTRSELQRVRSEYENAQGSVYQLREEVAGLRAELRMADKEASDTKEKGRELERRMDIERQRYESQLKAAEQRLIVVKQEMEEQRVALEVKIQSANVRLGQVLDSTEQASDLRREKLELQTRLSAAERYAKDGQHRLTELQQQYSELQSRYEESAELQRRLDQADEDRKTLVTELEAMRAELSTAAAQKDEAMSARAALEDQLASFHQRASASKDETLKKLQTLKVRAAGGGAPSSSAPAGEADGRVEQKQEQDDAHLQVVSLQSQVAQLTATVAELQGRNLQFLQEMQGGQETDNTYQARLSSLERRLASVTVELQDRDAEVKVLTERLRIAVHEAKDKQTGSTHESRDLKERLEQQSQELEGLRRANAIFRDEATQRQEDSSRAGPSAPSMGPLSAYPETTSIHPTQDELQRERTARQEAERREKHAREQLEAMALEVQQLRVEASRAGQDVRTELRGQLSQAQAASASVQQEYHRLAGQLTVEAPDAVHALTADVQALETDNRALRATIEDLQRQLDDQNRLRSMLDSEDRVDRRLYVDLKEKHDEAVSQLQAAKREREDIRAQLETARTDEQAARRELEKVRSELETLEAKHEKALSDHHQKEEAAKRVNKTKNQLAKAKTDLESRLEQAEKRVSELEGELAKAQNDARQARDRAAKAQTDLNEMKKQLNSAQPQKGQPGADQQALQQEIEKLKHQLQSAQQQRTAPAIEIQRLQQQVAQLTAQNESQLRQLQQVPPSVAEQQKLQQELEKEKVRAEKLMKQNEWALETIKTLQAQVAARQQPRRNTGRAPKGPPAQQQAGGRGGGQAAPAVGQPRPPVRTPSPQSSARPAARPVGSTTTSSVPATGAVVADATRSGAKPPTMPSSTPTQPSPSAEGAQARREAPTGATAGAGGARVGGGPASRPTDGPTARPSKPVVTSATQQAAPQVPATRSQRPAATPPESSVPIPPHQPQTTATAVARTVVAAVSAPTAPQSLPQAGSRTVSQTPRVTAARSQVHTRPQPDKVGVKRPASSATQAVTQSATGEPPSQQPEAPEPKRVKTEPPVAPIPTPATAVAPPAPQPEEARVATGMEESGPEDVRTVRVLATAPSTVTAGDDYGSAMMVADDEEQAQQQPAPTSATIGMQEQAGEEAGEQRMTEAEAADEAVSMEEDQPIELTPEEAAEAPQSPAAAVLAPHAVETVATEEPSEGAGAQAAEVTEAAMEMAPTTEAKELEARSQEQREGEMQAEGEGEREGEGEPVVEEPDTEMQPQAAQGNETVEERQEDQVEEEGTAEGEEGLASEEAETMEEGAVQAASGVVEMTEVVEGLEGEDGQTEAVGEGHEEQEGARMQEGQEQEGEGESASSEPRLPSAVEKSADDEHIEHDEEADNAMQEGDVREDGQERQDVPENREEEGNEEEERVPPETTNPDAAAEEGLASVAEARMEELSQDEEAEEAAHLAGDEGEEGDETGAQPPDEMEAPQIGAEVEVSAPGHNQQADGAAVEDEAVSEMPVVEAPGEGEAEEEQGEKGHEGEEGDGSAMPEGEEGGHEKEEADESAVREGEEEGLEREKEDESAVREGEPTEEQLEGEKEGREQTQEENEEEDVGQGSTQADAEDGMEDEKGGTQVEHEDGNGDVTGERGMEPPDDVYTEIPVDDPSASNEGAAQSSSLSSTSGAPLAHQTPAAGGAATMSAPSSVAPTGEGIDECQTQGEHARPEQMPASTLEAGLPGDSKADHGEPAEGDVTEEGLEDQQDAEQGDGTGEGDDRMDEDDKDAGHEAGHEDSVMMEE